jgi:hypothetical protein
LLAQAIREKLRDVLIVQATVELVPWRSLPPSESRPAVVER